MAETETNGGKSAGQSRLTLFIVVAIVAAVILALVAPRVAMKFDIGGKIFLRVLQMVVVPLVMASVMSGILGLGDIRKLGRPGGYTIVYYLSTTLLAVITGLIAVNLINPGRGIKKEMVLARQKEGADQVEKAAEARGKATRKVTWQLGTTTHRHDSGTSDAMSVSVGEPKIVRARIVQEGDPETPARVQIQVRGEKKAKKDDEEKKEEPFKDYQQPLVFGQGDPVDESDDAKAQAFVVELPDPVASVRLKYTAQSGGAASAVTAEIAPGPPKMGEILEGLVLMLFTNNLLESMVEMDLLPLIVFSIVFAAMLTTLGKRAEALANVLTGINDALMSFILLLMKVAPLGIFCLVTARFGQAQAGGEFFELIKTLALYMTTVLVGLAFHVLITLPLILWIFTRRNPYQFIMQMSQAILTAFSTASSSATLPITMESAEFNAGVSRRSTEFVLPLGATINMDGTALYEAAAAIFIAQAYSVVNPAFHLDFVGQVTVAITATLAAIGAAGIPEAGLVTMLIVLNAVGLPVDLIGMIIAVDWLLDRFRTAVNVCGDAVGSAIVDKSFPD